MRKLLISVAATALLAALPALAQPDHDHGPDHGGGGAPPAPHGGPAPQAQHGGGAPHPQPGGNPGFSRGANGGTSGRPTTAGNPVYSRGGPSGNAANQSAPNPAYSRGGSGGNVNPGGPNRPAPGGQGFNRGGPGAGPRHDFHGFVDFHQSFNATRRFHAPAYQPPAGLVFASLDLRRISADHLLGAELLADRLYGLCPAAAAALAPSGCAMAMMRC